MSIAQKIKVLIVDDQVTSRLLLGEALQTLGFKNITVAADGAQGLKIMQTQPHHLVISDFNMPNMDGLGFLEGALTAATCMDLGFYHVNRASLGLGSFNGFLSGVCDFAVRHGHTVFAKNFFRLVLMNIHVRSLSCLPYDFRWVRNLDFNVP